MDIDENIYKTNGFRILGLDITSKNRKIDNRISKIDRYRERKNFKDTEPLKGVFKNSNMDFLLPVSPEPSYNEYQQAKNRLSNVESRLIDEIFWFWPKSFEDNLDEEIVGYLKESKYNKAISYWNDTSSTNTMNMTSIHNLAILYHVRAMDGFIEGKGNKNLFEDLELALNYWSQIIDSNKFKDFVKQRVASLKDPRLTEEFVDETFEELPYNLLNINYLFIKKHLDSPTVGKRKLDYISKFINSIQNSPFDKSVTTKVSSKIIHILENLINEDRDSFARSFETAEDNEKYDLLFAYSDEIMPYLSVLYDLKNDTFANNLLNNTCRFIYNKIPTKEALLFFKLLNESQFNDFIDLLKSLEEKTTDSGLKSQINEDISLLTHINDETPVETETETNDEIESVKTEDIENVENEVSQTTANVEISVKDGNSNNLISNVTFTNSETGEKYEYNTSLSGSNTLNSIPIGRYRYKVEKPGYENYESTITFDEGQNRLDIKLNEIKTQTSESSYNKKFVIFVAAIIFASLAYYAATNLL